MAAQDNAIELKNITKRFGSVVANDKVCLTVKKGEILSILGENGSGKTTLFRLILGLESPDRGEVLFKGSLRRPQISAVFQEDRLLEGFSAVENLFFALGNRYSKETLTTSLLRLLPADALEKPVCEFSGGMKRRLSVLRALLSPAEIILMDEPFTGLDPATKQTVIDLINELCSGKLLIASTHGKEDAVLLNAKIILNKTPA